jgi:hypothetical protein
MKKIIRLSESELVSLVKRTIMEDNKKDDIVTKVGYYKGKNPFLLSLYLKTYDGYNLTDEEIIKAEKEFEKEESIDKSKVNMLKIEKPIDPNSLIQKKGVKTYLDIIGGEKNILFNTILSDKNIKISKPDDKWFEDNIRDLKILKDNFKSSEGLIKWMDGEESTFEKRIDEFLNKCKKKDFVGFIEEYGKNKVWSDLNKIDTHYTNWRIMMDDRLKRIDNGISGKNQIETIENYFKQRPLSDVLPANRLSKFMELQKKISTNVKSLSFADLDLMEIFGKKNSEKLQNIINNITHTTNIGNQSEVKFLTLLRNAKEPKIEEIVDFSGPGNIVDMAFGIDCAVKIDGVWYAIQVKGGKSAKNKAKGAKINKLGINSLSIYERNRMYQFNYFSPSKKDGDNFFNEDFGVK